MDAFQVWIVLLSSLLIVVVGAVYCWLAADIHAPLDFVRTADQQAQRFYDRQDYMKAAQRFTSPDRRGAALYRVGGDGGYLRALPWGGKKYKLGSLVEFHALVAEAIDAKNLVASQVVYEAEELVDHLPCMDVLLDLKAAAGDYDVDMDVMRQDMPACEEQVDCFTDEDSSSVESEGDDVWGVKWRGCDWK